LLAIVNCCNQAEGQKWSRTLSNWYCIRNCAV